MVQGRLTGWLKRTQRMGKNTNSGVVMLGCCPIIGDFFLNLGVDNPGVSNKTLVLNPARFILGHFSKIHSDFLKQLLSFTRALVLPAR